LANIQSRLWAGHKGNDVQFLAGARDVLPLEIVQLGSVANPGCCVMSTAGAFSCHLQFVQGLKMNGATYLISHTTPRCARDEFTFTRFVYGSSANWGVYVISTYKLSTNYKRKNEEAI
jgi:hypothetical protein